MKKKGFFILLLLINSIILSLIPFEPAYCDSTTIQIDCSICDVFMTETLSLFKDTYLIKLKDPNVGVMVGLRFSNIPIERWEKVNEAILSVYTHDDYENDTTLMVTIYGYDVDNKNPFNTTDEVMKPLTGNYVNWNISQVEGSEKWHNVTVTSIVQEITNRYGWAKYNDLGFKILSTVGTKREFTSMEYNPSKAPKLYLTWKVTPEKEGYEYVKSYKGYDIYRQKGLGHLEGVPKSEVEAIGDNGFKSQHQRHIWFDNGYHYVTYYRSGATEWDYESSEDGEDWAGAGILVLDTDRHMGIDLAHEHLVDMACYSTVHAYRRASCQSDGTLNFLAGWQDYPIPWAYESCTGHDNDNYPYVAYNQDLNDIRVMKSNRKDGIWADAGDTDWNENPLDDLKQSHPILLELPDNEIYVIGGSSSSLYKLKGRLRNPSTGWASVEIIETDGIAGGDRKSVTVAPDGDIYVSYRKSGDLKGYIKFREYDTGIWSDKIHLTYWLNPIYPKISVDERGYVYAIWYNATTDYITWLLTKDKGSTWENATGGSEPQKEFSETDLYSHEELTVFFKQYDDYIGVAWQDSGSKKVWYGCINNEYWAKWCVFLVDELLGCFDSLDEAEDFIDDPSKDPYDPEIGDFPPEGGEDVYTRDFTKLLFLIAGLSCVFIPLWSMSYSRPMGAKAITFIVIMITGLGLLIQIRHI